MKCFAVVICLVLVGSVPSLAHCETWYVTVDGTGDAPTIQAAVDSAAPGDTVLVAAGTYNPDNQGISEYFPLVMLNKEIVLASESGPESTILDADGIGPCVNIQAASAISPTVEGFTITRGSVDFAENGAGVRCYEAGAPIIRNNIITENWAFSGGAGIALLYTDGTVTGNLITYNTAVQWQGGGILCMESEAVISGNTLFANTGQVSGVACQSSPNVTISNNIIAGSSRGTALGCVNGTPTIMCNDLWDNADGAGACTLGVNNFSEDPMFCDPSNDDFSIDEDSPCAPGNTPGGCELVGALPVGCRSVPLGHLGIGALLISLGAAGACRIARNRNRGRL